MIKFIILITAVIIGLLAGLFFKIKKDIRISHEQERQ